MFARMWPGRARPVQAWRAQNESAALYGRSRRGHLIACREGTWAAFRPGTHRRFAIHTIIECEYGSRPAKSKPSNPISSRSSAVKSTLRKTPNPPMNYVKHSSVPLADMRTIAQRREAASMISASCSAASTAASIRPGTSSSASLITSMAPKATRSAEHVFRIRWLGGGPCATCRPRA